MANSSGDKVLRQNGIESASDKRCPSGSNRIIVLTPPPYVRFPARDSIKKSKDRPIYGKLPNAHPLKVYAITIHLHKIVRGSS